jgi:general stress protein YciG
MYEQTTTDSRPASRSVSSRQPAALSPAELAPADETAADETTAELSPADLSSNEVTPAARPAPKKPLQRGFAVLDAERRKEIARLGGKTAHKNGNAHRFNPEEASMAGKKGGATISENRDYMADIGRRGGLAKRGYKIRRAEQQLAAENN